MEKELIVKFQCTAAECDAQRELSLLSLASHIIETATAHADSLGIGNGAMPGSGWVLARLTIEMQRYPKALEDYSIITWGKAGTAISRNAASRLPTKRVTPWAMPALCGW